MDVLIIGNGFDLAHRLKTSYKDFLDFCKVQLYTPNPVKYFDYKRCFATNLWLKHFILKQDRLGKTWIDLENEIYNVVRFMNQHPTATNSGDTSLFCPQILLIDFNNTSFTFNQFDGKYFKKPSNTEIITTKNYKVLTTPKENEYKIYLEKPKFFINFLYDQLREFTQAFEQYLLNEVMSKLVRNDEYILSLNNDESTRNTDLYVLSFNYTDTCFKLYDHSRNPYSKYNIKTIYIHGKAQNDNNCELVLGTHSFKSSNEYGSISPYFNVFKKHNQRHKYNTIEAYQKLLNLLKKSSEIEPVFYVIGHSLDKTDHKILKHIFQANKNAVINIYWHDEEAQERLINNINEIIGEDEVMSRVRLIKQDDKKRGILIRNKNLVQTTS